MITYERAHKLFLYDPHQGLLIRRTRVSGSYLYPGEAVGTLNSDGYLIIMVGKLLYKVHRLIWLMVYGYTPENQIDHIDRDRSNNRLTNLREVSAQCNVRNSRRQWNNTSGVTGVYRGFRSGKAWRAQIGVDGKIIYIGSFDSFEEAVRARHTKEIELKWQGCNSTSCAYKYLVALDAKKWKEIRRIREEKRNGATELKMPRLRRTLG